MEHRIWVRLRRNQERNQPPSCKKAQKLLEKIETKCTILRWIGIYPVDGIIIHLLKGSTACFAKSEPAEILLQILNANETV